MRDQTKMEYCRHIWCADIVAIITSMLWQSSKSFKHSFPGTFIVLSDAYFQQMKRYKPISIHVTMATIQTVSFALPFQAFAVRACYATSTESNRPHFLRIRNLSRTLYSDSFSKNSWFVEHTRKLFNSRILVSTCYKMFVVFKYIIPHLS